MSRLAKGGLGGLPANRATRAKWATRANRANPPPSDPALTRQLPFEVTYGAGGNRANREADGGGGGAL